MVDVKQVADAADMIVNGYAFNMGAGHSALLSLRYCNGGEPHGSWSVFNDQWSRNPYIVSSFT